MTSGLAAQASASAAARACSPARPAPPPKHPPPPPVRRVVQLGDAVPVLDGVGEAADPVRAAPPSRPVERLPPGGGVVRLLAEHGLGEIGGLTEDPERFLGPARVLEEITPVDVCGGQRQAVLRLVRVFLIRGGSKASTFS